MPREGRWKRDGVLERTESRVSQALSTSRRVMLMAHQDPVATTTRSASMISPPTRLTPLISLPSMTSSATSLPPSTDPPSVWIFL